MLLEEYSLGELRFAVGITQGVSNSNYLLELEKDGVATKYILTLFEQMVEVEDLPFFMQLKTHLNTKKIACPLPMPRRNGKTIAEVKGRKAVIVSFLEGRSRSRISPEMCASLGRAMAEMHVASEGFTMARENSLSLGGWQRMLEAEGTALNTFRDGLYEELNIELSYLTEHWPNTLPAGVVHADLFPDNVFFKHEEVSGIIDFYFACNDVFAYDLAICLNCWCFEYGAEFNLTKAQALLRGYNAVRPLSEAERNALPVLARGACMRFLLTRAHDALHPADGALIKPKDPMEYVKKLAFHQAVQDISAYGL